jgi:hypothetical protein
MSSLGGDARFLPLLSSSAHAVYRVSNPTSQALFLKGDDELALTRFVGLGGVDRGRKVPAPIPQIKQGPDALGSMVPQRPVYAFVPTPLKPADHEGPQAATHNPP